MIDSWKRPVLIGGPFNVTVRCRAVNSLRLIFLFLFASLLSVTSGAAEVGEDGLHKQPWFTVSFKDIGDDIEEASAEGKRLILLFEQRGCIYCKKLHEQLLSDADIQQYITEHYNVVQYNLFGDEEVTDIDGEVLSEKSAANRWSVMFTPLMLFMPEQPPDDPTGLTAANIAVAQMPGVFGKHTFKNMLSWVFEKGYENPEHFQQYHARKLKESK